MRIRMMVGETAGVDGDVSVSVRVVFGGDGDGGSWG